MDVDVDSEITKSAERRGIARAPQKLSERAMLSATLENEAITTWWFPATIATNADFVGGIVCQRVVLGRADLPALLARGGTGQNG